MKRFPKQFFTMPRTFRQWAVEFVGGVFLGLASFSLLVFCSPPLPFYPPHCATGWNDPMNLVLALIFFGLGRGWHAFTKHPPK